LSPTQRSYLISFVAGAVGFGLLAALEIVAHGGPLSWQPLVAAFSGGVVAFARDWLRNNSNARLEKPDAVAGIPPAP
jgi:hypothetical protein